MLKNIKFQFYQTHNIELLAFTQNSMKLHKIRFLKN